MVDKQRRNAIVTAAVLGLAAVAIYAFVVLNYLAR